MGILIVIGLIVVIILWAIGVYNKIITLEMKINKAFADIDTVLKRRFNVIPNLVDTVKSYVDHEKVTFKEITEIRSKDYSSMNKDEKIEVDKKLSQAVPKIFAVAENYPELKATDVYEDLNEELVEIEEDIMNSRKYYNAIVGKYNITIRVIPNVIVANFFNFKPEKMFTTPESERKNIELDL